MRNKSSLMIIASMVLFLLSWSVGEASTWYVSKSGNDANTGNSLATSKLTIQAMINSGSVVTGDIIDIGAGTYIEQVVITSKSLTLRGHGASSTIIQAPTWGSMTIYNEAGLLFWNTANVANSLPTSQFRPIIYVDAASNSYTFNIYGIKVDGNSEAPATPTESFVGIMFRNAQGTVGNSSDTGKVQIVDIDGAGGTTDNTNFGFGLICMGTANPLIQYTTFTGYHNAAIASIGRSLSSTLTAQMPNPVVADCIITGTTQNNTGWYSGTMNAFGGKITARRNFITAHRNTGGGFYSSGMLIFDGRDALIGSNSVKSDGNNIIGNDWGLNVIVTNTIIGTPSLYTIKNNNIAYNGNGESGLTCSGAVTTSGCVRYENTTSGADRILALPSNAWGNADPLNNGYGISTGSPVAAGTAADAFWSVTSGDKMTVASPAFATTENVDPSFSASTVGFGYSSFATIQKAVDAAGNPSTILVKDSTTYTENVCIFNKNNVTIVGDSTATCGSSAKPIINPASGNGFHIYTLNAGATTTTNIIVNGFYFRQVSAQRVGILVTGYDAATNSAANKPPTGIQVRNTCFEGYATQAADGSTVAASAAMSSQEYSGGGTLNNTGRHSYGGNVAPAVADASDIDAQANNNFNYNGTSTSPSFKIWDKTDRNIADGANYYDARILQTNLIIVYCGDDLNTALAGLGAGPVTVYLQGDCIYKSASRLTISGVFDIGVDYTGRYQLPPLVVEPAGIVYANATSGLNWDDDCDVTGKPGVRFVTNATQLPLAASLTNGHQPSGTSANASATYMKTLTPVNYGAGGYDYKWTNYGTSRPSDIEVAGSNVGALLDAIDHIADTNGFAGTVTVQDAANFATGFDLHKRIRFATKTGAGNAQVTGTIRLWNKVLPFGPDCSTTAGVGALDDILDTRVTSGTFTAMNVQVGLAGSAAAIDRADNTDTTNTIQQGLVFTRAGGTCVVNNYGNYTSGTAQTPVITRSQVTLTSDDAAQFVQLEGGSITLNGSGVPASQSIIRRFSVDTVKMSLGTDAIQTAIGAGGVQNYEGVGFDNQAGNTTGASAVAPTTQRVGTIVLNFAGASSSQTLLVDKNVRFKGNSATPNTNSGSLTMRLGAQGTNIAGSTDFCNNTVNVTQVAGSGYTQIPDIQDGLLLACSGQTVNVGSPATATTWGGGTDTYNRDNTISKPVLLQGTNTTNVCANTTNGGGFYIDATTAWTANASRSAFTSTFSSFTAANPIFKLDSAVNGVTIQGFDFTSIANGAAQAIVYSRKGNNTVTLTGNVVTNSSEQFVQADSLTTARTAWNIGCNRITVTATAAPSFNIFLDDINGLTMANNNVAYTAPTAGTEAVLLGGVSNLAFTDNVVEGSRNGGLFIHKSNSNAPAKNTPGGTNTIQRNRFRANNSTNVSSNGGLVFQNAEVFTGTWTISNNFINNNTFAGVEFSGLGSSTPIPSINTFLVNDNSITGNTAGLEYLGLSTSGPNANCGINARGNWWNNASGPTTKYNPLNITPCTATSYGDIITQNSALTCPDSVTRVSFVPWWTLGTDANATLNGWQAPAAPANVLGRVVRTNSTGTYQASYATISLASAATSASDKVFVIQGLPSWTPAPGPDAASGPWGAYFSEAVPSPAVTGVEFRGVTTSAYSCDSSKVKSASVYLAGTDNITNPVPSSFGAAITPNTAPINGQNVTGFSVTQNNTTIRNFNIQGFSSTAPTSTSGSGIRVTNVSGAVIEANNFNGGQGSAGGTSASWGTFGIYLDRATFATVVSNTFGDSRDLGSIASGVGGVAIHSVDATVANAAIGPIAIGQTSASSYLTAALGTTTANAIGGRNTIRNTERVGIQIGGGGASNIAAANSGDAGASTIINGNTIQGVRDVRGGNPSNALGGVFINASAGTIDVSNNRFGDTTIAGIGTRLLPGDNKIDIILGVNAGYTYAAGSDSNTIRSTGQSIDGSDVTVLDSAGTRGAGLRTFFNAAALNTFSHAAILTTDATKPYDFTTAMTRTSPVVARGSAVGTSVTGEASTRIYRKIATPMSAIGPQTFAAGTTTFTNVVEIRENAAWALAGSSGSPTQYYAENLTLPSTTGIQQFLLLGPKPTNALNNTSAHIISSTGPGTGTAITASGSENKFIRGGIVLHAVGAGLYGSIPAVATNKGDVYLQRTASGADLGFVQFAYAATFGSQSLVTGTGSETNGNNNTLDKPSIIKAGLDDANDDAYLATAAQNRRTGVFQAGNGTTFTKPVEPVTGLGTEGLVAYPNPANGGTVTVNFQVPNDTYVRIALYDALGRKVTDLNSGNVAMGVYNTSFDVSNLPSGSYTVRMEYDYFTKTTQVSVVK